MIHNRQGHAMKFFVDTANFSEIKELAETGLLDGVTTNPSLVSKTNDNFIDLITKIAKLITGPVSAEVASTDYTNMMKEGEYLASLAKNIAVKVPLTQDGLKVCKNLTSAGAMVNVTLCFSASQALLAAKAGATFISPFIGRLDDISCDGLSLISDIVTIYQNYDFATEVLVASIRNPLHIVEAAKMGAHVATIPPQIMKQLFHHPLTDLGLEKFTQDWQKSGQSIFAA